jgi:hypothetical protein
MKWSFGKRRKLYDIIPLKHVEAPKKGAPTPTTPDVKEIRSQEFGGLKPCGNDSCIMFVRSEGTFCPFHSS